MDIKTFHDQRTRGYHFSGVFTDFDLRMATEGIGNEIRYAVAADIVNAVMVKLGPRIDEAVSQILGEQNEQS